MPNLPQEKITGVRFARHCLRNKFSESRREKRDFKFGNPARNPRSVV